MPRASRVVSGLVVVVVLALTASGVAAHWSDGATVPGTAVTAGRLDVVAGTWQPAALTLSGMIPGESAARAVQVSNAGTVDLRYRTSVARTGTLGPHLEIVAVTYAGAAGAAGNTGTLAAGNRAGTCSGAASPTRLVAGASEFVCVVVRLAATAPAAMAGRSGTVTVLIDATNPAAPGG